MNHRLRWLPVLLLLVLATLACSLPGRGAPAESEPAPPDSPPVESEPALPADPFLAVPGADPMEQTTPVEGGGPHPVFAWMPVEGADRYMVLVFRQDGTPYWAWEGASTSVVLGGFASPPAGNVSGPLLRESMRWAVVAFDAGGAPIASSPLRPVEP